MRSKRVFCRLNGLLACASKIHTYSIGKWKSFVVPQAYKQPISDKAHSSIESGVRFGIEIMYYKRNRIFLHKQEKLNGSLFVAHVNDTPKRNDERAELSQVPLSDVKFASK